MVVRLMSHVGRSSVGARGWKYSAAAEMRNVSRDTAGEAGGPVVGCAMDWQAASPYRRQQRLVPVQSAERLGNPVGEAALQLRRKHEE